MQVLGVVWVEIVSACLSIVRGCFESKLCGTLEISGKGRNGWERDGRLGDDKVGGDGQVVVTDERGLRVPAACRDSRGRGDLVAIPVDPTHTHTHTLAGPPWALLALVVKRPHLLKPRKSCVNRVRLHSYRGFPRLSIYEYSYRGFPRLNIYECGSRHPPFSLAVFWRGTGATANPV